MDGDALDARGQTRRFLLLVALSLFLLGLIGWPAVAGKVYTLRDQGWIHVPLRHFYAQCLANGDAFTWLPHQFSGFYLHAEGQVGMFHPAHWLLYRALPFPTALTLNLAGCYALMLPGGFLWLRRWNLPRDAALFGSFGFAFSSFNVLHFLHLNGLEVIAHIPWLLLAIDVSLKSESPRRTAWANASVSALTASQLLLGHPHYLLLTLITEMSYVLLVMRSARGFSRVVGLAAAKALGVAGGALQLLPTWMALLESPRVRPTLEYLGRSSLHPVQTLTLVAPYLVNDLYMNGKRQAHELYNGALTTVLAVWLLLSVNRAARHRVLVAAAFAFGGIGLFLSYGKYNLLFGYYASLPLLDKIRAPHRWMLLVHLALAVLAAVAFARLSAGASRRESTSWSKLWPLLGLPLAGVAVAVGAWAMVQHPSDYPAARFIAATPLLVSGIALLSVATALVLAAARGHRIALELMLVFMALDLAVFGVSYLWKVPPVSVAEFVASRDLPPVATQNRVQYTGRSVRNVPLSIAGIRMTGGYMQLAYPKLLDYYAPAARRLAGVEWIWSSGQQWTQLPDPLPPARLVTQARVSTNPGVDVRRIDLETTALVERPVRLESGPQGHAEILEYRPGKIRVATSAPTRQLLVLAESFHEGWEVMVQGRPRPVERLYGDFIGCVVEAGESVSEFRFRPADLRWGTRISAVALALVILQLLFSLARVRRAVP